MIAAEIKHGVAPALRPPHGFPELGVVTRHRRLLDEVVGGTDPTPEPIVRFGLPFAVPCRASWRYGSFVGEFCPAPDVAMASNIVFGGYIASLVDQFAGLVTYSVLPEDRQFLTVELTVEFKAPLRTTLARAEAVITDLTERKVRCEVSVYQDGRLVSVGRVLELLVPAVTLDSAGACPTRAAIEL